MLAIIQELADLEHDRKKEVNKLKRRAGQTISLFNYNQLENIYTHVRELHSAFNAKVDDRTELLDVDEEGDPIHPEI